MNCKEDFEQRQGSERDKSMNDKILKIQPTFVSQHVNFYKRSSEKLISTYQEYEPHQNCQNPPDIQCVGEKVVAY